jgi:WD40 repeat protein
LRGESHAARLFLVVDQFEELFTLCRSDTEREIFLNNLLTATAPDGIVTVIVALRADFYAHCATFAPLREALASHQEFIGPMQTYELRQAIEEPARQENWFLEEGLVDLLLKDVQGEPGGLPLLSHTLLETWARRRGRTLTLAGFALTGGVRGALARTAERVYQDFTPEEQKSCRNIFLRLTEPGIRAEGDDLPALDTRRRAALPELILHPDDAPLVETVVQTLADARLITTSAGSVEVAHESLIREWPTLRGWLEEDREGLRLHRHLTEAAQAWVARAREAGELYRGARLAQATEWAVAHPQALNALEREFLLASQTMAEHEIREREAQRQHELETAQKLAETERQRAEEQTMASRRLRQRAWLLAGAGALVSLLAVIAIIVGQQARTQARIAFARELAAASESSLTVDPERSALLALEAIAMTYEQDGTVIREAETALHRALPALRALLTLPGHEGRVSGISVSPDGNLLATASADGTVKLWNIALEFAGQREIRTLTGHEDWVYTVHFSPNGTRLASASADGTVRVWETATGRELLILPGHEFGAGDSAFSPDGKFLATGDGNGAVFLWDVSTAPTGDDSVPRVQLSGPAGVAALGFSPDGHWLAMGSGEGTTVVWELGGDGLPRGDQAVFSLCCHNGGVGRVVFSPDSARLATSGNDNTVRLWEMAEGKEILGIYSHGGPVDGLAFDASGTRLATGSGDGTARVWDVTPGQAGARELVTIYVNNLIGVAFSPDSTRLVTGSESGSATVWDLSPSREKVTLAGHTDWVFDVVFSPSGNLLATASNDGTVIIWDAETGAKWRTLAGHSAQVWHLAFSPDGTKLATTSSDTTAKVWEVQTGQELFTLTGHVETLEAFPYTGVGPVAFSADGRWLATGGGDHTARLWDAETGAPIHVFSGHTLDVNGVAFTPDGTRLLTVSFDSTVKIWETATGNLLTTLSIPGEEYGLWGFALSPDGMHLAVSQHDGSISMWDVNGNLEQPLYTLTGHTSIVIGLAFSPDGARLATASFDGTTKLWEVSRGVEWLTLSGHAGNVIGVAFSPDGTHLATSSGDGTVRVYVLPIQDLIALAHSRLTRGWLEEECQQFLHLAECP